MWNFWKIFKNEDFGFKILGKGHILRPCIVYIYIGGLICNLGTAYGQFVLVKLL